MTGSFLDMLHGSYCKIAFLDKNVTNREEQEFRVIVVRNRGVDTMKFEPVREAESW